MTESLPLNKFWLKYLDVKCLIDVASQRVEDVIIGKPEEILRQLISENNLTEVEESRRKLRMGREGKFYTPDSVAL